MRTWLFIKLKNLTNYKFGIWLLSFLFPLISAFLIWQKWEVFPLKVPFWFSKPFGEEQLASPSLLWLVPALSFSVVIINLFLGNYLWSRQKILSFILTAATPIISGLFFYTLLKIVFVST